MSKDKNRAERRRHALVVRAGEMGGRLLLNWHGGMPSSDADLMAAQRAGLFHVGRDPRPSWRGGFGHRNLRTYAVLTEAGFDLLARLPESREPRPTTCWRMWWQRPMPMFIRRQDGRLSPTP